MIMNIRSSIRGPMDQRTTGQDFQAFKVIPKTFCTEVSEQCFRDEYEYEYEYEY